MLPRISIEVRLSACWSVRRSVRPSVRRSISPSKHTHIHARVPRAHKRAAEIIEKAVPRGRRTAERSQIHHQIYTVFIHTHVRKSAVRFDERGDGRGRGLRGARWWKQGPTFRDARTHLKTQENASDDQISAIYQCADKMRKLVVYQ